MLGRNLEEGATELTQRADNVAQLIIYAIDWLYSTDALQALTHAENHRSWFGLGKAKEPYHSDAISAVRNAGYEYLVSNAQTGNYLDVYREIRRNLQKRKEHILNFAHQVLGHQAFFLDLLLSKK